MKKKLLSMVITFILLAVSILSMPLISSAATHEKLFDLNARGNVKSITKQVSGDFISFNTGTYADSKVQTVTIESDIDDILYIAELNDGDELWFIGKMQKIVLPADGKVTLSAELTYTDYYNDAINFTICTSKNLSSEVFGIGSEEGQRVQESVYLKKGTYYLTMWREMLLSDLITEEQNGEYSTWITNAFAGYQIDIKNTKISTIPNKNYTGSTICPPLNVVFGNTLLTKENDYTVQYKYNKDPGKASVVIIGKNNFTGKKSTTFKIIPKKPTIKKINSTKKRTLTISWSLDSKSTGYQVTIAQNKSFTKNTKIINTTKYKANCTFKKLTSQKKYFAKVRTYKTIDGKKYFSPYSKIKSVKVK